MILKCKENVQFYQHSYIAHFPQIPIIGILCYFVWSLADRLNNVSDMMAKRVESRICEVAIKNSWVRFSVHWTGSGCVTILGISFTPTCSDADNREWSVPIHLAQFWFPGLTISNAEIKVFFSNKIYGSTFIKQNSEIVWFEITKMLIAV